MIPGAVGIYWEMGNPQTNDCGERSIPETLGLSKREAAIADGEFQKGGRARQGCSMEGRALPAQPCSPGKELQLQGASLGIVSHSCISHWMVSPGSQPRVTQSGWWCPRQLGQLLRDDVPAALEQKCHQLVTLSLGEMLQLG